MPRCEGGRRQSKQSDTLGQVVWEQQTPCKGKSINREHRSRLIVMLLPLQGVKYIFLCNPGCRLIHFVAFPPSHLGIVKASFPSALGLASVRIALGYEHFVLALSGRSLMPNELFGLNLEL